MPEKKSRYRYVLNAWSDKHYTSETSYTQTRKTIIVCSKYETLKKEIEDILNYHKTEKHYDKRRMKWVHHVPFTLLSVSVDYSFNEERYDFTLDTDTTFDSIYAQLPFRLPSVELLP